MSTKKNVSQNAIDKFIAACELIEKNGLSAIAAQRAVGINSCTFHQVINSDDEHKNRYARAMSVGVDVLADEIVRLSSLDDIDFDAHDSKRLYAEIQRRKLQTDNLKWILSKRCPKKYGDKLHIGGDSENPIIVNMDSTDSRV